MDHVRDRVLCLVDVARFWAREPSVVYTEDQIVTILVQAVWRGELVIEPPAGHAPRDDDYRYSLLRAVVEVQDHPGLLFVRPGDQVGPIIEDLPDGGALYDPRERIAWVAADAEPEEATAVAAYAALAEAGLDAYAGATVLPVLRALPIKREALQRYCELTKIPLPKFWFPPTATRGTVSAERQRERWLADLARMGRKPDSKGRMRDDAMMRFPGLSGAAFDRAWNTYAPSAWKESGAPTNAKRCRAQ